MHNQYIYLIAPISAWMVSQLIKLTIERLKKQKIKLTDWLSSGNLPSTHVAGPTAFLTVLFHLNGVAEPVFGLGFLFTVLVAYDSLGVRRTAAETAERLEQLSKEANIQIQPIHIFKGHTLLEVLAGAVVGIVVGIILLLLF